MLTAQMAANAEGFSSFDVNFDSIDPDTGTKSVGAGSSTGASGASGKMTFAFTKSSPSPSDNTYILDLTIANTSFAVNKSNRRLAGFSFNLPGKAFTPPDIKLLTYNPLDSNFGVVYGAMSKASGTSVAKNSILPIDSSTQPTNSKPTNSKPTSTQPTSSKPSSTGAQPSEPLTFCTHDLSYNCGGSSSDGLKADESTAVRFTLASNVPTVDTAEEVAQSFFDLFNSWDATTDPNAPQVALRFENATTSKGGGGPSEKVGGLPRTPSRTPANGVPGPLPILGAATAFGFSRRVRRRIAVAGQPVAISA
jgi:hypothetical protein